MATIISGINGNKPKKKEGAKMKAATIKIKAKSKTLETIYLYDTYNLEERLTKANEELKDGQHLFIRCGNTYSYESNGNKSDFLDDLYTILFYVRNYLDYK